LAQAAGTVGGVYIVAAYWFTASTSFANLAVALARSLSNTFAGIRPIDVPPFILAQFAGGLCATLLFRWLAPAQIGAPALERVVIHTLAVGSAEECMLESSDVQ
jgi:hypothetical protein